MGKALQGKKGNGIVGYVRVSTKMQADSGLSIAAQTDAIRAYASRHDLPVAQVYVEQISGKTRNRPVLTEALGHALQEGHALCVARLDRLSRNVGLLRDIIDSGVTFIAIDYPSADRMLLTILAAVAEYEAEKISTRIQAVTHVRRQRGDALGKPENFSAEGRARGAATNKQLANDRHCRSAAYARELRARGLSLRAIAAELSKNGYGEYTPTGVSRVLKRECP